MNEPEPIALRIVVDGASTAGKTTTARSLGDRLGRPVTTPEEEMGRTLLFDWLDHTGGRSDGRAIRTQVVAVPGHLPHLRVQLLVTADVVLFVADTTASGIDDTVSALAQVRELIEVVPKPAPGLLVQANKRDCADALPMAEVRRRLDLPEEQLVVESVATDGEGVRQAFVYAVRLGLQRVRGSAGRRVAEDQGTAEDLLAALEASLRRPAPTDAAPDPGREPDRDPDLELEAEPEPVPVPPPESESESESESVLASEPESDPVSEPVPESDSELVSEPDPESDSEPESAPQVEPVPSPRRVESPLAAIGVVRRTDGRSTAPSDRKPPPPPWRRWLDR